MRNNIGHAMSDTDRKCDGHKHKVNQAVTEINTRYKLQGKPTALDI